MLSSSRSLRFPQSAFNSQTLSGRPEKLARWAALLLVLVCMAWDPAAAQSGVWTWMGGSSTVPGSNEGQPGVYGMIGKPAASNIPGGRGAAALWKDQSGNIWLFGGYGFDANGAVSYLNDLWELDPSTNEWAWMSGSTTIGSSGGQPGMYGQLGMAATGNVPGGRAVPSSWIDTSGNLWLFGGYGYDSVGALSTLNDVWEFTPSTMLWTWMGGSSTIGPDYGYSGVYGMQGQAATGNLPGSRYFSTGWTDSSGNFWLFGGYGFSGNGYFGSLNDLWRFTPSTNEWAWMGGGNTITGDNAGSSGVYGMLEQQAAGNTPGGRAYSTTWIDSNDNVWLFGGGGFDADGNYGYLNDMWELDPSNLEWTWMGGSSTVTANSGQPGMYGMLGTPAEGNTPGGRETAIGWLGSGDELWLFGGSGYDANDTFGSLGDLWEFAPSTDEWAWMGGSSTPGNVGQAGMYGKEGVQAAANFPGGRYYVANWTDSSGAFWLFGGLGQDANNLGGFENDLWRFQPAAALASPAAGSVLGGPTMTFTWSAAPGAIGYRFRLGLTAGANDIYGHGESAATTATVTNLPTNGETIYATLYTDFGAFAGSSTISNAYTFTAGTLAALSSPAAGSILGGPTVTFTWSAAPGATGYNFRLGTTPGASNIYGRGESAATTATVTDLPTNGETIYATLYTDYGSIVGSPAYSKAYTFKAGTLAALSSPAAGSVLGGPTVTFIWSAAPGATGYNFRLGTTPGASNIYGHGESTATSATVTNLPTNGETIYATLYTDYGSIVGYPAYSNAYTFTAGTLASLSSPTAGSALGGPTVRFTWSAAPGATGYNFRLGITPGAGDLYSSPEVKITNTQVTGLPTNGETIYATLYTDYGSIVESPAYSNAYTFTAGTLASLSSPAAGSALVGTTVTFTWSAAPGATGYSFRLGSTPGANNLYASDEITATTATVTKLPTNGETIYATLYTDYGSIVASPTYSNAYTFTAYTAP